MQRDIAEYYEQHFPGQVQVVGVDELNGTAPQLRSFRDQIGATFPLLLQGGLEAGGNFVTLYGARDNYVVVNKQGIVRYHAQLVWPYGDGYHLNEIRGTVDSLVTQVVGVDPPAPAGFRLAAIPNPARDAATIELAVPPGAASSARVTVHDLSGRRIATLWEGSAAPGLTRIPWRREDAAGAPLRPGIYLIRAEVGPARLVHRAVVLP